MANLLELPLELVLAVVQLLGNEDLRRLSLVCRHVRPYCQAALLQTCTIPITLERSVEEYRVLFQTPHFNESIHFLSIRGRVLPDDIPASNNSSGDEKAIFAEVAGHIPTLRRLRCIEMSRVEPGILLLDAIFRSTVNKPMRLLLNLNTYPEEYTFPSKGLEIYHIEACVTRVYGSHSKPYTTPARLFLPRLVSACAATLSGLHIYDDHIYTKMWDISSVQLRSLTAAATQDPGLVTFLRSQASLEELSVIHDDANVSGWASKLSGSDLPNLRSVTASFGSLRYLVPGRAIREANPNICCGTFNYDVVYDFLRNTCSRAAGNGIEKLDLGSVLSGSMGLQVLSESQMTLSNIQCLGIPCLMEEFSEVFTYLRSLPRLNSLNLLEGRNDWANPSAALRTEMIEYSSTLRESCQSFERLTVSMHYNEGQLHVDYDLSIGRWTAWINKTGRCRWAPRFT